MSTQDTNMYEKSILRFFTFSLIFLSFFFVAKGNVYAQAFDFFTASDMRQFAGSGVYDTTSYFRGAVEQMNTLGPSAFLFIVGDLDPVGDTQWTIEQYLGIGYTWYPVVGNHELPDQGNESYSGENMDILRAFSYGVVNPGPAQCSETTFSFDYLSSHFTVLNEYCDTGGDTATAGDIPDLLYNWLDSDLAAASSSPHIFVIGHEPAFPQPDEDNGRERHMDDSLNQYPTNRDRFWSLLEDYNVDAYFCGHTHDFSTYYDELWQIDSGHARGLGDTGAKSTFVRISVTDGQVDYEGWRDDAAGGAYVLVSTDTTYTVATSAGANGVITPSGYVHVNSGDDVTFTITADNGYHVTDVVVDSVSLGVMFDYTFLSVSASHTIEATFAANPSPALSCTDNGGIWESKYEECFDISETDCVNYSGTYYQCGSACRYGDAGESCVQSCIPYCVFSGAADTLPTNGSLISSQNDKSNLFLDSLSKKQMRDTHNLELVPGIEKRRDASFRPFQSTSFLASKVKSSESKTIASFELETKISFKALITYVICLGGLLVFVLAFRSRKINSFT